LPGVPAIGAKNPFSNHESLHENCNVVAAVNVCLKRRKVDSLKRVVVGRVSTRIGWMRRELRRSNVERYLPVTQHLLGLVSKVCSNQ